MANSILNDEIKECLKFFGIKMNMLTTVNEGVIVNRNHWNKRNGISCLDIFKQNCKIWDIGFREFNPDEFIGEIDDDQCYLIYNDRGDIFISNFLLLKFQILTG